MYKLEFELEQHTPIIHFQARDAGATLRASEVKPKLDKFVLTQIGKRFVKKTASTTEENFIERGIEYFQSKDVEARRVYEEEKKKGNKDAKLELCLIPGQEGALNYKMRIIAHKVHTEDIDAKSAPMYFGKKPKRLVMAESVQIIILVKDEVLKGCIKESIVRFFQLHNFGTRQSKGYGSFTIKDDEKKEIIDVYKYSFDVSGSDYKEVMNRINYFYKSLRSGINEYRVKGGKKTNILYFKSALHYYVTTVLKEQWDKKSIKEYFFPKQLEEEKIKYKVKDISSKEKNDFRDLLGFSTDEAWGQKHQVKKTCKKETDEGEEKFSRLKSPIQFKPIRFGNNFTVFFDVFPESSGWNDFLGSEVCVEALYKENATPLKKEPLTLKVPTDIDLKEVLGYIFSNMKLELRKSTAIGEGKDIFDGIKAIYDELERNKK